MSTRLPYGSGPLGPNASPRDFSGAAYQQGIYTIETTQRFVPGTRYTTWDGREFRYCKSSSALNTSEACHFAGTGKIAYTSATVTVAVGATELVIPAAAHDALTEDELAGGFITIFGSVADGADMMFRQIVGNEVSASAAAVTIYLEFPTDIEIDTSSAYEVWENPYTNMAHTSGAPALGKLGPPAAYVTATGNYFWCQTRGPIFQNPQSTVKENEGLGVNWRGDGSLDAVATALTATVPDVSTTQYAGYRMMGDYDNNGPIVMLLGG